MSKGLFTKIYESTCCEVDVLVDNNACICSKCMRVTVPKNPQSLFLGHFEDKLDSLVQTKYIDKDEAIRMFEELVSDKQHYSEIEAAIIRYIFLYIKKY